MAVRTLRITANIGVLVAILTLCTAFWLKAGEYVAGAF